MTAPAEKENPQLEELKHQAAEATDTELCVSHFVIWLRQNRSVLGDISDDELQSLAYECAYHLAYDTSA